VDPKDPRRINAEIYAEKSEPLAQRRIRMDRPRAWIYLSDGRSLLIEAARGQATLTDSGAGGRPEDGLLEGDVVIRMFARVEGAAHPDPASATPLFTLRTPRLRFDGARGEGELPEAFTIRSDRVDLDGERLSLLFNESERRVELLRIERTTLCTIRPGEGFASGARSGRPANGAPTPAPSAPANSSAASASRPGTPPESVTTDPAPTTTYYHATISDAVAIRHGPYTLDSDRADAWVRLIDDALPDDAIASTSRPRTLSTPPTGPLPIHLASLALAVQPSTPPGSPRILTPHATDEPVSLSWNGPLEFRSLAQAPVTLTRNHVFTRFTSERDGGVRFADSQSKAQGNGMLLEYGATRRDVALGSSSPSGAEVELTGRGVAHARRFEVSLPTGRVSATGPGSFVAATIPPASGPTKVRSLTWSGEGHFKFAVVDGDMTGDLVDAHLAGDVAAADGQATLSGNSLTAVFTPIAGNPAITSLDVIGNVAARDPDGGTLTGDALTATFEPSESGDPIARRVLVRGNTAASREGNTIAADTLDAALTLDNNKQPALDHLLASGNARFTGAQGESAMAPEISADPNTGRIELKGEGARIGNDRSRVSGPLIVIEGQDRTITVPGEGRLDHAQLAVAGDNPQPETRATVTWTTEMFFDDVAGIARCVGDAKAVIEAGPLSKDTLAAETVIVELSPREETAAPKPTPAESLTPSAPNLAGDRRFLAATALGGATPATIESRRYAPDTNPPALQRLLYLEGARIDTDAVAGTLDVPTPGKLLAVDRRRSTAPDAARTPGPLSLEGDAARGNALFTWTGSLHMDRPSGELRMLEGVRLVHDRLDTNDRTELECRELTARVRESAQTGATDQLGPEFAGELISANAKDSVWMRAAGKELRADELTYDAVGAIVDASAGPGRTVSMFDPQQPAPVNAQQIVWFLKTGRVETRNVRPITAPR